MIPLLSSFAFTFVFLISIYLLSIWAFAGLKKDEERQLFGDWRDE